MDARRLLISAVLLAILLLLTVAIVDRAVAQTDKEQKAQALRAVKVTDGITHSVPLDDIIAGGPSKDGIPAIDRPSFVSVRKAERFLEDDELGIAIKINGVRRFYPVLVLLWHEVVNDTLKGRDVTVTYCPLCGSGIVFDARVNGERQTFGVSGMLYNSNLLMYDRKTESFWSQILGEAIIGKMAGTRLKLLPSDTVRFGDWKRVNRRGKVLSTETGVERPYGQNPYIRYAQVGWFDFPIDNHDDRLHPKKPVLAIYENGRSLAFLPETVKKAGSIERNLAGRRYLARYEGRPKVVRVYERLADGDLKRVATRSTYWFCWAAVHPTTDLVQ